MAEDAVEHALNYVKTVFVDVQTFKDKQIEAISAIYSHKDVIVILPTGYGKSLIFQILPWLFQKKNDLLHPQIVIIVTPLNCIMEDQVRSLCEKGLPACFINVAGSGATTYHLREHDSDNENDEEDVIVTSVPIDEILQGKYNIIYAHPEALLENKQIYKVLQSQLFQEKVCCTVVDEVHMISEWGTDFRKCFSRLGELTCLFPSVPHLALTATVTEEATTKLCKILQFKSPVKIVQNPDRSNIYIQKRKRLPNTNKFKKYDELLFEICEELKEKKTEFPVTIVYVDNLECLGYCYTYFSCELGSGGYINNDCIPENRIFSQYHKDYTNSMKKLIISELMKENPIIRLVFATVALGMGLNSSCISRVIHFRPPTSIEQYMQEIGRAGRNGQPASAIMYYNNSDISSSRKGMDDSMKKFCLSNDVCLRQSLLNYFGFDKLSNDKCCSVCDHDL